MPNSLLDVFKNTARYYADYADRDTPSLTLDFSKGIAKPTLDIALNKLIRAAVRYDRKQVIEKLGITLTFEQQQQLLQLDTPTVNTIV